jgi:hypothetical protein
MLMQGHLPTALDPTIAIFLCFGCAAGIFACLLAGDVCGYAVRVWGSAMFFRVLKPRLCIQIMRVRSFGRVGVRYVRGV